MIEEVNVNTLTSHVVYTIDLLLKDRHYPKELLNYLYLIATGMIIKYGDCFIDDIYSTIACTKFNINNNLINEKYYKNPTYHNYTSKWLDLTYDFPHININHEILYKKIDSSFIKTLEYLTHELNLILFNKNKKYSLPNQIKIRYDYYKNGLITQNKNETIDKVFNVLCTEDIIKNILNLQNYKINNQKFNESLQNINNVDYNTYKVEGLDLLVNLFRPLYKHNNIKILINNNILIDNNLVEKEFDNVLGKHSYRNICNKLNYLDNKFKECQNGSYSDYYTLSIEYMEIRDNYINKYISYKYATEKN